MRCVHGIGITKDCYYCINNVEPTEDTPKIYGGARAGGMTNPKLSQAEESYYGLQGVLADCDEVSTKTVKEAMRCIHELNQNNRELVEVWDNLVVGRGKTVESLLDELFPAVRKIRETCE